MENVRAPRLKEARRQAGLSQRGLARQIGVDRTWISRVERGLIPAWPRFRKAAADALGTTEDSLFGGSA